MNENEERNHLQCSKHNIQLAILNIFIDEIFDQMNLGAQMTNSRTYHDEKEKWEQIVHVHDIFGAQLSLDGPADLLECLVDDF